MRTRAVLVLEAPAFLEPWQARALQWRLRMGLMWLLWLLRRRRDFEKFTTAAIADSTRNCSTTHSLHRQRLVLSKAQRLLDTCCDQRSSIDLAAAPRGQTPHQHRQHVARQSCTRVLTSAKCLESPPWCHIDSRLKDARQPCSRIAARRIPLLRDPRRRRTTQAIPPANTA